MKIERLIEKLQVLAENQPGVDVYLIENGFRQKAVEFHLRPIIEQDLLFYSDVNDIRYAFTPDDSGAGVVIGTTSENILGRG